MNLPKFKVGSTVATPGAIAALEVEGNDAMANRILVSNEIQKMLRRHICGDWGECCEEDKKTNDNAIAHEGTDEQQRVMSVYRTKDNVKIWCITEWDRSVTTFLLPSEY